jgi:hypothetical protein
METTISIIKMFMHLASQRVIFFFDSCNATTLRGIVQIEHPGGTFSMTNDRFNELIQNGSILVQRA